MFPLFGQGYGKTGEVSIYKLLLSIPPLGFATKSVSFYSLTNFSLVPNNPLIFAGYLSSRVIKAANICSRKFL